MTRVKQTREVGRPLLEHDSRLAQVGRWIFVSPATHLLVGFHLYGSADTSGFYLTSTLVPLFHPEFMNSLGYGERFSTPASPGGFYHFADPKLPEIVIAAYETVVRPLTRLANDIPNFYTHLLENDKLDRGRHPGFQAYCYAAMGKFDKARQPLNDRIAYLSSLMLNPPPPQLEDYKSLRSLLDTDPNGIGTYLREIELKSAQSRKIERFWTPAPFPFEK